MTPNRGEVGKKRRRVTRRFCTCCREIVLKVINGCEVEASTGVHKFGITRVRDRYQTNMDSDIFEDWFRGRLLGESVRKNKNVLGRAVIIIDRATYHTRCRSLRLQRRRCRKKLWCNGLSIIAARMKTAPCTHLTI